MDDFQIGTFLKRARERQNLSTRDLAERAQKLGSDKSVTGSQINRIENNKTNPGFQTLQIIAASLDLPLVIVFDGNKASPDTVAIVATHELSQSLRQALHRADVVELLAYCQELTDEQVKAILGVAQSIRGFTRSVDETKAQKE